MMIYDAMVTVEVMHLSTECPTIPLPCETKGYQGIFTGEAGPRDFSVYIELFVN